MKLLTTIAAVLISISAYSQDLIEYDNGTFTQNGEELSMEQIDDLTLLHKAGRGNVRKGNRFDHMYKDRDLLSNNGLNAIGGVATGFCGGIGVLVVAYTEVRWIYRDASEKARYVLGVGTVTGLCVVSYKAFSMIALSLEGCLRKRDKEFYKVADKLNEAIKAANQ
ncbi:hypothetical protein OAW78_00645 [Schleiferiaceae bacterium]|nr:hypothetical protein [Schleiferiaceae bacterium]